MKMKFRAMAFIFIVPMLASCFPEPEPVAVLPPCETFTFSVTPPNMNVTPVLQQGDRDFDGNGPSVDLRLILQNKEDHLFARFYMAAEETDANGSPVNDESQAEAWFETAVWAAPDGILIKSILVQSESSYSYRDANQDMDVRIPIQGPVAEFRVFGDTSGDDIGSDSRAVAVFRTFDIELQQTQDCE